MSLSVPLFVALAIFFQATAAGKDLYYDGIGK